MGRLLIWVATAVVVCAAAPREARADDPDRSSKADATFQAGRALLKDKQYADACPKFAESQREDPASGTLLALAYCQELSGLLATSWRNYLAAAQLAEREGHADRQAAAEERAKALGERVSRVTVVVPAELLSMPGFRLLRDGLEVERASYGTAVASDGGSHVFTASAPGRLPWTSTVTVFTERDKKTLVLPMLDVAPAAAAPAAPSKPVQLAPAPESAPVRPQVAYQRASLAFAAASVVGFGLSAAFAVAAKNKNDDSKAFCDGGCDTHGVELRNSALSSARIATWSFVAGTALAACSVTLYLSAGHGSAHSAQSKARSQLSLGAQGIAVSGSF